MDGHDRAYLSVIDWPEAFGEARQAEALVGVGLDPHQSLLCVRRGFPQVVACIAPEQAGAALDRLHARSVVAFAPRRSEMRALSALIAIKSMTPREIGGTEFECEGWRGEHPILCAAELTLIVRGRVTSEETRVSIDRSTSAAWSIGGPEGALIGAAMSGPTAERVTRQTGDADVLDFVSRTGERVRVTGSRFNFDVLGDRRGSSNHENAAALLAMLTGLSPRAIVDDGFARFRCPPDVVRSHWKDAGPASVTRTTNAPAFDFYSAWAMMMYRHFTGA